MIVSPRRGMPLLATDTVHRGIHRIAIGVVLALALGWIVVAAFSTAAKSVKDRESMAAALELASRARLTEQPPSNSATVSTSTGYSLLLSIVALAVPPVERAMACHIAAPESCRPFSLAIVTALQLLAALGTLLLVYQLSLMLSGERAVSLLVVVLCIMSARFGQFAGLMRGFIWFALLIHLHLWTLLQAATRRSPVAAASAGISTILAALFEPTALLLTPLSIVMLLAVSIDQRPLGERVMAAAAFTAGSALAVVALSHLSSRYGLDLSAMTRRAAIQLSQRLAFNDIERHTLLAACISPIPIIGDLLQPMLSPDELRRIAVGSAPGSIAVIGGERLWQGAVTRAGDRAELGALMLLIEEQILARPLAYAQALPPTLMRGVFGGGGLIALLGLCHLPALARHARGGGRLVPHLFVLVPVCALFLANSAFTGNEFWLNPALPFIYAYALVYVAGGW